MDKLKRARAPVRAAVTKACSDSTAELAKDPKDLSELAALKERLEKLSIKLEAEDLKVIDKRLESGNTEDEINKEMEECEVYQMQISRAKAKISMSISSDGPSQAGSRRVDLDVKLPKMELAKFSGETKDWLGWWAQFKEIHENPKITENNKFRYLIQSLPVGSKAATAIEGFQVTADNYPKAIEMLSNLFGNPKKLWKYYLRELAKLIQENASSRPNATLFTIYHKLESHLRALESLGNVTRDDFLYPLVENSIPKETLLAWQRSSNYRKDGSKETPPKTELDYLREFLRDEVENEDMGALGGEKRDEKKKQFKEKAPKEEFSTTAGLHVGNPSKQLCVFCDKAHQSQDCFKANGMDFDNKKQAIRAKQACLTCFKAGHMAKNCKAFIKCSGCDKKHYHIMCPDNPKNWKSQKQQESKKTDNVDTAAVQSNFVKGELVLLETLKVKLATPKGLRTIRVLLDRGSQRSFIRTELAKEANCGIKTTIWQRNCLFTGILTEAEEKTVFSVPLQNLDGSYLRKCDLIETPRIAAHIPKIPQGPWLKELQRKKIWLSDVAFGGDEIDVLIGGDLMQDLLTGKSMRLKCGLIATQTVFGWVLMGRLPKDHNQYEDSTAMMLTSLMINQESPSDLWSLEVLGIQDPAEHKTRMEKEAEVKQYFLETVSRNEDGRYRVKLPWVGGVQNIPSNRSVAEKRLLTTTQKLKRDGRFKEYDDIFRSWEKEEFIESINPENKSPSHYLPHRPVYKPESKSTPVRPVFDASCKVGRNPSLNDCLEKGTNYIELIPSIMLRFREGKIGVVSDIRKAFLMIEIEPTDRDYLRFLWWEDETCTKIKEYRHRRVVFGKKCSPFLLGAVIEHHLLKAQEEEKEPAKTLLKSFYVDNLITTVDTMNEYKDLKENATRIMMDAKMELRQWEYGPVELSGIDPYPGCGLVSDRDPVPTESSCSTTMVLGMKWDKQKDVLSCVLVPEIPEKLTKRSLLSTVQKIYDPMGHLSPAMILPKLLLQESWAQELDWDHGLPEEVKSKFMKWAEEIKCLEQIEVPRNMTGGSSIRANWSLHVFCDASQVAFAAIIFLRTESMGGVSVQLIQSKSRVAPMKKLSIPRLELLGCFIAARLTQSVKVALTLDIPTYFWSDSTTALTWIKRNDEWGTFVGNRVKEICKISNPEDWRHVPGALNPADLPSRGCTPEELLKSRWWEGPTWLKKSPSEWPTELGAIDEDAVLMEKRKTKVSITPVNINEVKILEDPWYAKKFSSFASCVRLMAWILRFITKARKLSIQKGELTSSEVDAAEKLICKLIQTEAFSSKSQQQKILGGIQIFREDGVIHANTKLLHRQDSEEFRKPIMLPHSHPMVDRLIREEHLKNCHAGAQFLMARIREKFWIIRSRKAIRKVVQGCVKCRRFRAKPPAVPVAPLPEDRIKNARAFEITGVDLAGPLYVKKNSKVWIVLFTCAVYRGIHLELVSSLSTDSFLLALFRFMSRRGRPSVIYSDNGTNFVGADNLFKTLDWKKIQQETRLHRLQWRFNPPSAAWWGGWWERLIQTVKDLLRKMLGHKKLSHVQLETALCEVEAVVNARPLTCVTEDPDDLIPLTPAMFLQDLRESESPEFETLDAVGFRKKYRDLVQLKQELRQRFRNEYLGLFAQKGKVKKTRSFQLGEVVFVASDNQKRMDWPLARVIELLPGKDGEIRVARIKTASGELLRPLQRLIPLEVASNDSNLPVSEEVKIHQKEV